MQRVEKMNNKFFCEADILLPEFIEKQSDGYSKYSVIACDQYTSEPEYWDDVKKITDNEVSTINLVLPEIYLASNNDVEISKINQNMNDYLANVFKEHKNSIIYVERMLPSNKKIRKGLVGIVDLESYDFKKGSKSLIRATEETVIERIPPRVKIRENAVIELPHVMLFVDDSENIMIDAVAKRKNEYAVAYDFDLMKNSGNIKGYFIDDAAKAVISSALDELIDINAFNKKYNVNEDTSLLFAVGDGNHSLASAKACYENLKAKPENKDRELLSRYALVEIVNIHDEAIEFEPIYRIVKGINISDFKKKLSGYFSNVSFEDAFDNSYKYNYYSKDENGVFYIKNPSSALPVGEIQPFLDKLKIDSSDIKIDYIHGVDNLKSLSEKDNCVGIIFDGMRKEDLFLSVIKDGALPRKTFSMGEADDKRFYLEARKIKN